MNFTNTEYVVFRSLLILEFIWIIINMNIVFMAIYLIVNVPQFHRNLIGMMGNMGLAFFVIAISRIIQIVGGSFDPHIDSISWTFENMRFFYIVRRFSVVAIYTYVFTILSISIERTLATFMLKTYEDCKQTFILILTMFIPWTLGLGINLLVTFNVVPTNLWVVFMACIIGLSLLWQLILHYFNLYRHKHSMYIYYNLRQRFQVSENIRFLRIVKWSCITAFFGDTIGFILYIWLNSDKQYNHVGFTVTNFVILFNSTTLPIVVIWTNYLWKKEFLKQMKTIYEKIKKRKNNKVEDINHRFNAPYLKTLAGNPMVFSAEQEKEMYFKHLKAHL